MDQTSAFKHQTEVYFAGAESNPTQMFEPADYEQEVAHVHANETASQLVAYTSPYLFWVAITVMGGGYLALF